MNLSRDGVKDRKEREREARQRAILEAAKEVFLEKGIELATMEEIAGRAELGKGTLYFYFKGKEEIALALLREGVEELFREVEGAFERSRDPEETLRELARAYFGFYRSNRAFFKIFVFGRRRAPGGVIPREWIEPNIERGRRCLQRLAQVLAQGVEEGRFKVDDPQKASVLLWGLLTGVLFLYEDEINRELVGEPLEEMVDYAIEFCLRGLKG